MTSRSAPIPKLNLVYYTMQIACIVAAFAQILIDSDTENLIATTYAAIGSTVLIQYLLRSNCAQERPLSCLALVGLNVTSLLTSLVAMSAYGRPLTENLRAPDITFPLLASVQVIAVLAHWIYCNFTPLTNASSAIASHVFKPVGLFATPHIYTVWTMGLLGAASQLAGHANTGDVGGKAVQALGFLCWMPFLIPFYYIQARENFCDIKKQIPLILAFVALMIFVGLARNVRQIMMIGPLQLLFAYFIYLAITRDPIQNKTVRNYVVGIVLVILSVHVASDLVTAMGIARDKRDTGTSTEVIEETFNALFIERSKLDDYRDRTELAASTALYDEAHIPNPVLIRLSETKFHDNMLFFGANFLSDRKPELLEGMKNVAIATLPADFAKLVDKDYDKSQHIYSIGDYYLYLMWGESRLSSFVTGSIWADFYTLFGLWFVFATIPYLWLIFISIDSLSTRSKSIRISAVAICTSWPIFIYGIGGTSIVAKAAFFLREIPQRIVLYLIIFWIMYLILNLFRVQQHSIKVD